MNKIVFVDLEETLIVSWFERVLCNVEKIKKFFKENNITEINIFSFAIDSQTDIIDFESPGFKDWLEREFEVKIISNPSTIEIMKVCFKHTGIRFDSLIEFKTMWGKTRAFHDFCQAQFNNCECLLLDDMVQNTTFINHDKNLIIKTIKIG